MRMARDPVVDFLMAVGLIAAFAVGLVCGLVVGVPA